MSIKTIFAHVSCSDLSVSEGWYTKLFGKPPIRRPMPGLAEWHFSDSSELQLHEAPEHAGHSTLTIGAMPLEDERQRLVAAGLQPGAIEEWQNHRLMQLRDPDNNLVVFASPKTLGPKDADPQYGDGTEA